MKKILLFISLIFSLVARSQQQPASQNIFNAVVDVNGQGDYTNIQDAINNAPVNLTVPWLIFVKNGRYKEIITVPASKPFIHLIGQNKENTIISEKINSQGIPDSKSKWYQNDTAAWPYSVNNPVTPFYKKQSSVVKIDGADFYAENISFWNDWGIENQNGPMALAMFTTGDRASFYNCSFRSFQDTWQTGNKDIVNTRLYARECHIEGAVDYFYGGGNAFLDTCTLYNVRSGSVIVAPSHKEGTLWGYVFNNCIVDGNIKAADGKQKLGRPWHNLPQAVFINTTMKVLPHPEGWTDMGPAAKLFAEYNSKDAEGNIIDLSRRRTWYKERSTGETVKGFQAVLTKEQAEKYNYKNVIQATDNWNPRAFINRSVVAERLLLSVKGKLSWMEVKDAIGYIVLKDEKVIGFTRKKSFTVSSNINSKSEYTVQPVNKYGSVGVPTTP